VNDKIGLMNASEGLKAFPVMNYGENSHSFGVKPGGRLEIISKPRKINGANLVRVRDLTTGLEGEVFWKTLSLSTSLEKP